MYSSNIQILLILDPDLQKFERALRACLVYLYSAYQWTFTAA